MGAINKILEALNAGEGKKAKVIIINKENDSENGSEETKVMEATMEDSTRAAKIAKMKCMIFIHEQVNGLSVDEAKDVIGNVGFMAELSRKLFDLDNDLAMSLMKKSEEKIRRKLTELESDESAGD